MLPFVGISGSINAGVSTDRTLGGAAPYVQIQVNPMVSAGVYGGLSGSAGGSHSNGQITSGFSNSGYVEIDGGFGPSGGINFSLNDDGTIGGVGGSGPIRIFPGLGYGAAIGAGRSLTGTFVFPSLNDLLGKK
ncbi:hypothetical protein [Paraburkholderia domus]|uniref:Uncharacterized protein n=1 Tax=Paraburkholderia domus TaxID=2793075 RepID=A0A9N8N1F8_9BURK|nr:hypothetical protein [Paraburkholderia domus]MBK5169388.1 hypothetical protein [Burkholderia sp. R-70211]CAE6935343.1 hypothetical protein R70211_05357 [Paraburkholderia domus]